MASTPQDKIKVPLTGDYFVQSGYIYAQGAGSSGADNSAPGIHLRWALSRDLGNKHLPKGNLAASGDYQTSIAYNKPNDFVRIFRTEYKLNNPNKLFPAIVKFTDPLTGPNNQVINSGATREWRFLNIVTTPDDTSNTTDLIMRFADIAEYDTIRTVQGIDPATNPSTFLAQYNGMIEAETPGKLLFAATIGLVGISVGEEVKMEAISTPDRFTPEDKIISCRRIFTTPNIGSTIFNVPNTGATRCVREVCENIEYVRFTIKGFALGYIAIETYHDFLVGSNGRPDQPEKGEWDEIGNFSLSLDDTIVFRRLENLTSDTLNPFKSVYAIDKLWPKYNDVDTQSGAFTVKVANYQNRWDTFPNDDNQDDPNSLRAAVKEYLLKSINDVFAKGSLPVEQPAPPALPDNAHLDISYLKMLQMVSLDYHVARMLGMGHIDVSGGNSENFFIYAAQYFTNIVPPDFPLPLPPPTFPPTPLNHIYLTIPVGRFNFRLPLSPFIQPVSYGLMDNSSVPPVFLTDAGGYSQFDESRFININKAPSPFEEVPFGLFFGQNTQYCVCEFTKPVLYGVEYRKQGETDFRKPELSNDPDFVDYIGRPETVPIIEKPNPIFVHQEFEEGVHEYAMYAINWFSRVSVLSGIQPTDSTLFPKRKTILPPANLSVQLIQKENPLIFTTSVEQTKLDALIANTNIPDKTLARITFDWNHVHNTAYQYGTYAEFFFRQNPPENIRGEIALVSSPDSAHEVTVTTKAYNLDSTSPRQTIQPAIAAPDINRYKGGLLTTEDGKSFVINDITVSGNNPTLKLQQVKVTESQEIRNNNQFSTLQQHISPSAGKKFMIVENLNNSVNWDSFLSRRIGLIRYNTDDTIEITGSSNPLVNKEYTVQTVTLSGGNTEVAVKESIAGQAAGAVMEFSRMVSIVAVDFQLSKITVKGDISSQLGSGDMITVLFSDKADGDYTVDSATLNGTDTDIITSTPLPNTLLFGKITFTRIVSVTAIDAANKKFTVSGDITSELVPSHRETVTNADLSTVEYNVGGISRKATIKEFFDVRATNKQPDPDLQGPSPDDGIPGSKTGIYKITFPAFTLENHPDPEVEWYNGVVRIQDTGANPEVKTLQVLTIKSLSPLQLIAHDATFDVDSGYIPRPGYIPIPTGNNIDVNFHPSYRTYLKFDNNAVTDIITGHNYNNNFTSPTILPATGQNTKQTFMGVRAVDSTNTPLPLGSFLATPVILLAREIVVPEPPDEPIGPLFATRPDFYGKSTYTIDVKVKTLTGSPPVGRKPFSLLFFRANERRILDVLYESPTAKQIITDLNNLQSPDSDFFNKRWKDFVNGDYDTASGLFIEYTPGGFRFPLPDNPKTTVAKPNSGVPVKPFEAIISSLDDTFMGDAIIIWVKRAIDASFLPLTEQPAIYSFIKAGVQASGRKPVTRNASGEILPFSDPTFDPFPMAVKYAKIPNPPNPDVVSTNPTDIDNPNNNIFARFTDFTLDGSSRNVYFYYAMEMSNNFELSPRSPIAGPIQLVNAAPAEEPVIKKTKVQLADPLNGIPTGVRFELNDYIASENIRKIQIYRAIKPEDSLSVRTMSLAKTVDVGDDVVDDFSDQPFPLFGEALFYRIIALREIVNEQSLTEFVPSKPSNMVLTNIVDNINPPAPQISYTSDPPSTTQPININNVVLSWPKAAHNANYHLYKMNPLGNWEKIFSVKTNADPVVVPLADTTLGSGNLYKQDADLNTIYHRFRVQVENSSGLLNIEQNELTI